MDKEYINHVKQQLQESIAFKNGISLPTGSPKRSTARMDRSFCIVELPSAH